MNMDNNDHPKRRASDHSGTLDISKMIMDEDDSKTRALLIILNNINGSLLATSVATNNLSIKLDQHLTNFETHVAQDAELLNKGRGAWRVAAWVIGVVQVIGLGIWAQARGNLESIDTKLHAMQIVDSEHDVRIKALERK